MGSILGGLGKALAGAGGRLLAGMGITKGTKAVVTAAEEHEVQKFTPQEGTLGDPSARPTPEERREMGEQLAGAHVIRGQRRLGWGGFALGIAVGIGVGLLLPASVPFAAAAVITGVAQTAVEGAVGVLAGESVTPAPTASPEPPAVQGQVGDDEPSVQSNQEEPSVVFATAKPSLQGHDDNVTSGSEQSSNSSNVTEGGSMSGGDEGGHHP